MEISYKLETNKVNFQIAPDHCAEISWSKQNNRSPKKTPTNRQKS